MERDTYNERNYRQIIVERKQTNELMQNRHMIRRNPILDILARGQCLVHRDLVFCFEC